jgi:hypothetical protein
MPSFNTSIKADGRGSAIGQFELTIEGGIPLYCKSIEGGLPKSNLIDMNIGSHPQSVKHLSTVEIEPLNIEIGMQDGLPLLGWIKKSWAMAYERKNGTVRFADFDMKEIFSFDFSNALITESSFPTLDGGGKDISMLKVKLQPEDIQIKSGDHQRLYGRGLSFPKQKMWMSNAFELELGNFNTRHVAKIDGFTVKQGVKPMYTGRNYFPSWEPTKLTFADISVHMTYEHSGDMIDWYKRTIETQRRKQIDPDLEVTGVIRFLDPGKKKEVFEIKMAGVGMKGMAFDKSERNDAPRRIKFDLYVTSMDLDTTASFT